MARASFVQAGSPYSPRFSYNNKNYNNSNNNIVIFNNINNNNRSMRSGRALSSSSYSSSSCSCSCSSSFSSGASSNWKHQDLRSQAMNTTAQGILASSSGTVNGKSEPDHLLVLVHGIFARYELIKCHSQGSLSLKMLKLVKTRRKRYYVD
uniref:Catalytic n=1 Tax=Rhizophora mucronata TaxID=61149 RepID=A0A2P2KFC5_RHIMU